MDFTVENPLSVSSVGAAVRNNDVEAVRRSIEKGRSIDLKDNRGWAAIHCAASENYTDCLNVLLKAGADVNIRTHEGETPLFLACARNCQQAVAILLDANCAVDLSNNEDITPLHVLASAGFDELATTLLNKQAYANAQDYDLDTPLLEAVRHGHANMCRILLSHGADQSICNSLKNLPIHYACQVGKLEIIEVLLEQSEDSKEYLSKILNWINTDGYSPLMLAIQSRNLSCVELLCKFGADANIGVDLNYGLTALHLAAYYGNLPILKVILNATSKETIKIYCCDVIGRRWLTRTNIICNAILSKSDECLEYLLDYGFDSDVLNAPFENANPIGCLLRENFDVSVLPTLKILLKSGYEPKPVVFRNKTFPECVFYYFLRKETVDNELAEAVVRMLVEHGLDVDLFLPHTNHRWSISDLIYICIQGGRFNLLPYLLQRSQVVEPYHVLEYVLAEAQWTNIFNHSLLIIFLSNYVDSSNLPGQHFACKTNLMQSPYLLTPTKMTEPYCYINHLISFPSLKGMARAAIREYIHCVCDTDTHQFKVKLNSLSLPQCLISYLNYEEMQTLYESIEKRPYTVGKTS